ncbi:hypothetical protein GCM10022628_06280 [Anoxybacillus suryakundensis]
MSRTYNQPKKHTKNKKNILSHFSTSYLEYYQVFYFLSINEHLSYEKTFITIYYYFTWTIYVLKEKNSKIFCRMSCSISLFLSNDDIIEKKKGGECGGTVVATHF